MRGKEFGRIALALLACVAGTLVGPVRAEEDLEAPRIDPKADEVVREVGEFYAGLESLRVGVTTVVRVEAEGVRTEMTSTQSVAMRRPDRLAIRLTKGMMGATVVCDGKVLYRYQPLMRKYTATAAPKNLDELLGGPDPAGGALIMAAPSMQFAAGLLVSDPYEVMMAGVTDGEYVGIQRIEGAECHHLVFHQEDLDWEIWVQTGEEPLVRRIVPDLTKVLAQVSTLAPEAGQFTMETIVSFDHWQVNPDLPDEAFAFRPPAGARRVRSFAEQEPRKPGQELVGNQAPGFELDLLGGGRVNLADHKDKEIVMLDFWATWCGPCRRGLPVMAEVAAAYKDRGVVFYAVNQKEDPQTISGFLQREGLALAVALDRTGEVGRLYHVRGIPQSVIIGKDGTVQAVHVGFTPELEATLRRELDALVAGGSLVE